MKKAPARYAAHCLIVCLYCLLPLLPVLLAIAFLRWRFIQHYPTTLRRMRRHLEAMREGPAQHFFADVLGRPQTIPAEISGSCVQCGNCCMERRCVFLEQIAEGKYQCGIYNSVWRRFSNCGSYPLNQHDIDRYACPSYFCTPERATKPLAEPPPGTQWAPIRFVQRRSN